MLTDDDRQTIITEYRDNDIPMIELSARYSVSRQAIHKLLRVAGVDTSKTAAWRTISCATCGKTIQRTRCKTRKTNTPTCSRKCYFDYLRSKAEYIENRNASRNARKLVAKLFDLQSKHIVHHIDGDQNNNDLSNLLVFASQADHVRHHRGFDVSPIWIGKSAA